MYEIEIKSLLGEQKWADAFRERLLESGGKLTSKNSQLNHYFQGDMTKLAEHVREMVTDEVEKLEDILARGTDHSVRTRQKGNDVILVVKASIDDGTSANAISRMEFESSMPITLEELDQLLLAAGLDYQAKWSRYREEYAYEDIAITLDCNAGYGWLSEFEKVVDTEEDVPATRETLLAKMQAFGLEELPQDRLERMFEYYNTHWPEYYGTDKVFVVK